MTETLETKLISEQNQRVVNLCVHIRKLTNTESIIPPENDWFLASKMCNPAHDHHIESLINKLLTVLERIRGMADNILPACETIDNQLKILAKKK